MNEIRGIIAGMLQDGVASGEFNIESVEETAEAVFNSMCKFHHPQMVAQHLQVPLHKQAGDLMRLLCRGLRSKEPLQRAS